MMTQAERNHAYRTIRGKLGVDRMGVAADAPPLPPLSGSAAIKAGGSLPIEAEVHGAQMYEYGEIWSREGLDLRTRCFISVAAVAGLNHARQLYRHINSALNVGITPEEIHELMLHVSVYGGFPAWENGVNIATEVFVNRGLLPAGSGVPVEPAPPMDHQQRRTASTRIIQALGVGRIGLGPQAPLLKPLPGGPVLTGAATHSVLDELSMINADYGYGEVWGRAGLELRMRSFITMALLQVMRENHQLHIHVNNALNIGITSEEIHEALAQAGIYGGISGWHNAVTVARHAFEQRALPEK
jgi:4-carboxymuconolactone decarboxylase